MYSQSYNSPPPELSNNPFIDHPANALNRYPDINGTDSPAGTTSQFTSWLQPQGSNPSGNSGYGASGQTAPYNGGGYQAPQQTGWTGSTGGGYQQQQAYNSGYTSPVATQPTGRPFQPSSSFGQQLAGQLNAAYPAPQQQQPQSQAQPQAQPQYTGYPTSPQYGAAYGYPQQQQPQQAQQLVPYAAEFDPYAQQTQSQPAASTTANNSGYRPLHPREFIQQHKIEMEAWDNYAWKQALNSFDALKEAWSTRKLEIEARARVMGGAGLFSGNSGYGGYGGYGGAGYGQEQEITRLEQMAKQAESNADTVVASKFQMQEVQGGYRQSGDLASKRRVRESINAALTNLPDWPPQQW